MARASSEKKGFTIIRNISESNLMIPLDPTKPGETIHLDIPYRGHVVVTDFAPWEASIAFQSALDQQMVEVEESATFVRPKTLTASVVSSLTELQKEKVRQSVHKDFAEFQAWVNVVPNENEGEYRSIGDVSPGGKAWLTDEHLPVLEACLAWEKQNQNREERIAELSQRISQIRVLNFSGGRN